MDIAGSLYFLKLSINTVTAVLLVLVVGLSVDYAVHVAHAFMRATGSRKGEHSTFYLLPEAVVIANILFCCYCRKGMYYIIRNRTTSIKWWNIYCACICVVNPFRVIYISNLLQGENFICLGDLTLVFSCRCSLQLFCLDCFMG